MDISRKQQALIFGGQDILREFVAHRVWTQSCRSFAEAFRATQFRVTLFSSLTLWQSPKNRSEWYLCQNSNWIRFTVDPAQAFLRPTMLSTVNITAARSFCPAEFLVGELLIRRCSTYVVACNKPVVATSQLSQNVFVEVVSCCGVVGGSSMILFLRSRSRLWILTADQEIAE
eukprot:s2786_g6.t1